MSSKPRQNITVTTTVSSSTKPLDGSARHSMPAITTNTRGGGSIGNGESDDGSGDSDSFKRAGSIELGGREKEKDRERERERDLPPLLEDAKLQQDVVNLLPKT